MPIIVILVEFTTFFLVFTYLKSINIRYIVNLIMRSRDTALKRLPMIINYGVRIINGM